MDLQTAYCEAGMAVLDALYESGQLVMFEREQQVRTPLHMFLASFIYRDLMKWKLGEKAPSSLCNPTDAFCNA